MRETLSVREKIYEHIDGLGACGWSAKASDTDFERYCIAKDTIQDTGEALLVHREKGFTSDPYLRYVEYYGVLQAVYMQQDAIQALYRLFATPPKIDYESLKYWNRLRDMRNDTVGHPVGKLQRLNRNQISYDCVNYMRCPNNDVSSWVSNNVNPAELLDGYDTEAASLLAEILRCMESDCAAKHGKS